MRAVAGTWAELSFPFSMTISNAYEVYTPGSQYTPSPIRSRNERAPKKKSFLRPIKKVFPFALSCETSQSQPDKNLAANKSRLNK